MEKFTIEQLCTTWKVSFNGKNLPIEDVSLIICNGKPKILFRVDLKDIDGQPLTDEKKEKISESITSLHNLYLNLGHAQAINLDHGLHFNDCPAIQLGDMLPQRKGLFKKIRKLLKIFDKRQ